MVLTTIQVVTTALSSRWYTPQSKWSPLHQAADGAHHTARGHHCINSRWYTPHSKWSPLHQAADGTHHTPSGHRCIKQQMVHTTLHVVTTVLTADGTHHTPSGHHCIKQQMVHTILHLVTTASSSRWYTPHCTWSQPISVPLRHQSLYPSVQGINVKCPYPGSDSLLRTRVCYKDL